MIRTGTVALAVLYALVGLSSCTEKAFYEEPIPTDPLAFRQYLMAGMPEVLEVTECQCCGKSLHQCYEETLRKEGPRCPDT